MDGKNILMSTTAGSLFPTNFNSIVSVMRTDPVSDAVQVFHYYYKFKKKEIQAIY